MKCKNCGKELDESNNGHIVSHTKFCDKAYEKKEEISKLYLDDKLSVIEISKKLNINKTKISEILGDNLRIKNIFYITDKEEEIIKLRKEGLTFNQIKNTLKCSKSTVSYYCKKHGLSDYNFYVKVSENIIIEMQKYYDEVESCIKVSEKFNVSKFTVLKYIKTKKKQKLTDNELKENRCKAVTDWRIRTKEKAVEYKGGKCSVCGYDKCINALCFHHINPHEKDFTISGRNLSWNRIQSELDKCVMLCSNCHIELHAELKNN